MARNRRVPPDAWEPYGIDATEPPEPDPVIVPVLWEWQQEPSEI